MSTRAERAQVDGADGLGHDDHLHPRARGLRTEMSHRPDDGRRSTGRDEHDGERGAGSRRSLHHTSQDDSGGAVITFGAATSSSERSVGAIARGFTSLVRPTARTAGPTATSSPSVM